MRILKFAAAAMALTLCIPAFTSCGSKESTSSSSKESSGINEKAFKDMAGEYTCTSSIVNIRAEGYESKDIKDRFVSTIIKISDDGTLTMEGTEHKMTAYKSENAYNTYLVSIDDSGNGYDGNSFNQIYGTKEYDGPSYFMFTAKGTDQDGYKVEKDTIELYFSPKGTEDWYFALDYSKP